VRGTKLNCLHSRPYKITVVSEIKSADYEKRVMFSNWFINHVHERLIDPKMTFFTDEAEFNLSGYVNSQNNRYWSSYFMQGSVTPHTANETICSLQDVFGELNGEDRINSKVSGPLHPQI
jgi:hypothetical protein